MMEWHIGLRICIRICVHSGGREFGMSGDMVFGMSGDME